MVLAARAVRVRRSEVRSAALWPPVCLLQPLAVGEGVAYFLAHLQVLVVERVEDDGCHLGCIHTARLVERPFVHTDVDDFAPQDARLLVVVLQLAFDGHRQFVDERCVDKCRPRGVEAGTGKFVGHAVSRHQAHVVAGRDVCCVSHADGKGPRAQDVLHRLVPGTETQAYFVRFADAAPGCVHGVGGAVFVVGGYDEDGLRLGEGLGPEFLSHDFL